MTGPKRHDNVFFEPFEQSLIMGGNMAAKRIKVQPDNRVSLPSEVMQALDIAPGSYVAFEVSEGAAILKKVDFDPFQEGLKKPDPDAFDKIIKKQKAGMQEAEKEFMERLKDPPEVKPEDRPDFWD